MKIIKNALVTFVGLICLFSIQTVYAQLIDPSQKYAWSENTGWLNFAPASGDPVQVFSDHLEGYAWNENIGWIQLGTHKGGNAHTYANTSSSDWGVNNDGSGKLSGFAWAENAGWINFNPSTNQVVIDNTTGNFSGYAWAERIGWINFNQTTPVAYSVSLSPPPTLPAPIITSPAGNSTPTFTGNAPAGSSVQIFSGSTLLGTTVANSTGQWSFTVPSPLAPGSHVITAVATPGGTTAPLSITVNGTGPIRPIPTLSTWSLLILCLLLPLIARRYRFEAM